MGLTSEQFEALMARLNGAVLDDARAVAVGVSGGSDSMALLYLLQGWCAARGVVLHALSVDHGLRAAAKDECAAIAAYCAGFEHVLHETLIWDAPKDVRIQEEARRARYDLMRGYCAGRGIAHLFLGHHEGDQAETFLFRLAKGSGLDGLAGMRAVQEMDGVMLCRPLLRVSKDDLIAVCKDADVPFIDDPSNDDETFARVRLRRSADALAKEGLTAKRLAVTAMRMDRARDALDGVADRVFCDHTLILNTGRIEFNVGLCDEHPEILIRVVLKGIARIGIDRDYAPRMERVEDLVQGLQYDHSFRTRTLGGVIFERDDKNNRLILSRENRPSENR